MKDWVEAQVKSGHYINVSDYVRDLIRCDQNDREKMSSKTPLTIKDKKAPIKKRLLLRESLMISGLFPGKTKKIEPNRQNECGVGQSRRI
jgi:Arc/MetJ-type ribon-helix-helix transcriptional regulator